MCDKCNGTGLIPFKNKEGKIIPHCWTHCDCHSTYGMDPEPEHYHKVSPEDYDFPMSETSRAWTYQHCGEPDPGYRPEEPGPQIKPEPQPAPKALLDAVHRAQVLVNDLGNRLNEHIDKAKKPQSASKGKKVVSEVNNREDITDRLYK